MHALLLAAAVALPLHLQAEPKPGELDGGERCHQIIVYAEGLTLLRDAGIPIDEVRLRKPLYDFDYKSVEDAVARKVSVDFITFNCFELGPDNLAQSLK